MYGHARMHGHARMRTMLDSIASGPPLVVADETRGGVRASKHV